MVTQRYDLVSQFPPGVGRDFDRNFTVGNVTILKVDQRHVGGDCAAYITAEVDGRSMVFLHHSHAVVGRRVMGESSHIVARFRAVDGGWQMDPHPARTPVRNM